MLFGSTAVAVSVALWVFIVWLDPYGLGAAPGRPATPMMDVNQRFMYPQLVRGGRFDAAVFGTSTIRLLDPRMLGGLFGARFVNLGLNAGTPWEQVQLAGLFLRHVPHPKMLIFGIDAAWCEADADAAAKRLTFRAFPAWLYDEGKSNDIFHLFTARAAELAARVALNRVGLMPERIRGDGYERFVPPESRYDVARARAHIARAAEERAAAPAPHPGDLSFPALAWLDQILADARPGTEVMIMFPPTHVVTLPKPDSRAAAVEAACKAKVAELGARRGAVVVDFRLASPVTTDDANYWDALHYRVGVAERLAAALKVARETRRDPADGFYRVLGAARPP